jgi:tripartite-type tricarboxylate transporter receptor subunit TctC
MQKALRTREAAEFYARNSIEPRPMTLTEMSAFIKSEYEAWGRAVKFAGIVPE